MFSFGKVKNLIIWWFIFAAELKTYYFRLNIFVYYILLTCGKHLHDRIISLREYVIAHSTSLTTPLFIEVHVSSQKSERSYKCVYRICIPLRFFYCIWNCPDSVIFVFLSHCPDSVIFVCLIFIFVLLPYIQITFVWNC
jgi:hypothetical protein